MTGFELRIVAAVVNPVFFNKNAPNFVYFRSFHTLFLHTKLETSSGIELGSSELKTIRLTT